MGAAVCSLVAPIPPLITMGSRVMTRWLFLLAASWSAAPDAAENLGDIIEAGYDKVHALNLADTGTDADQKGRKISEYYDAHLAHFQSPSALAGRAIAEVDLLF